MSSFLSRGKRQSNMKERMNTKKHVKHFYKALGQLDVVAQAMIKSGVAITEDNVETEASKYTGRKIDSMEKSILLSKVNQVYDKIGIETKDEQGSKPKEH